MGISRRSFLRRAALASAAMGVGAEAQQRRETDDRKAPQRTVNAPAAPGTAKRPVIVSKYTGVQGMDEAYAILQRGGDTLDAVLHVCKTQEDDPNDDTVGLGGLPNEEGVVELDACCMHGPTRRAGSVAAVRNIKNVSLVARAVMEQTGHVMLAGEGAERFAVDVGFPRENLLTDRSRRIWLLWKETMSNQDWWGPGIDSPGWKPPVQEGARGATTSELRRLRVERLMERAAVLGIPEAERRQAVARVLYPPTGTIHCSAVNERGEMSGATTTSGLAWKIPGRVGDSPVIGAGCYTDQSVGSAGATGSGEENLKVVGAHSIVELMRQGMSPREAGLETLRRIARNYGNDMTKLRYIEMVYYVLRRDGTYAGVSMWSHGPTGKPRQFAVHDGTKRQETCIALFQGRAIEWPPIPELEHSK